MNILVSGLLNIETTVSVRGFPIEYYPIDYPFFGVASRTGSTPAASGAGSKAPRSRRCSTTPKESARSTAT